MSYITGRIDEPHDNKTKKINRNANSIPPTQETTKNYAKPKNVKVNKNPLNAEDLQSLKKYNRTQGVRVQVPPQLPLKNGNENAKSEGGMRKRERKKTQISKFK